MYVILTRTKRTITYRIYRDISSMFKHTNKENNRKRENCKINI